MTKCAVFPVIDLPATGRRIEKSRKAAGLSVKDVQAYFGFEYPQAVYKWQHGECLPTVDNLLALSRLFETPMENLLVYEDQEVPFLDERPFSFFWGIKKAPVTTGCTIFCRLFMCVRLFIRHESARSACSKEHAACGSWALCFRRISPLRSERMRRL